ncbi:MAG TPA: hypothetical protein V6C65_34285 [Allocoleopsis sp.]
MNKSFTPIPAVLLNSLLIASGAAAISLLSAQVKANAAEAQVSTLAPQPIEAVGQLGSRQQTLPDGVYLYGESATPEQIGSAYLVFEVKHNQAIGAFYLPRSSFDCFQGEVQGDRFNLAITNSYDHSTYSYSLPVQTDSYIASAGEVVAPTLNLDGFHQIQTLSENDHRILETCKADYQ